MRRAADRLVVLAALALAAASLGALWDHAARAQEPEPGAWETAPLHGGPVYDLLVEPDTDPRRPPQRIVAVGHDVMRSTDGMTWTMVGGVPGAYNIVGDDGAWLVATRDGRGFLRSRNGTTWSSTRLRDADDPVRFLGAAPSFNDNGLAFGVTTADLRLYRTNSRGQRWSDVVVVRGAEVQVGAVAFSPHYVTDETVYAGTDAGLFVSTDSGQTWTLRAEPGAGVPAFGMTAGPVEWQGLHLIPEWGDDPRRKVDPDIRTVFAWNAAGAWISEDDARTWRRLDLPAAVREVRDVAVSPGWPADRALLVAADGDGLVAVASSDGGATWRTVAGEGGIAGTAAGMALDFVPIPPKDPFPPIRTDSWGNEVYFPLMANEAPHPFPPAIPASVHREMYLATDGEGVWRSEDDGRTWERPIATQHNVQPLSITALGDVDHLLAGTAASGLFRSQDGGRTWSRQDGLPRGDGEDIAVLRTSPAFASDRTVLAAAASGVWISRDAGATWSRTNHPAEAPVRALALSPAFATDRTVLADGYRSTDGGATWSPVEGARERPWSGVAISPRFATDGKAWAVTDVVERNTEHVRGLWTSVDGGATWSLHDRTDLDNQALYAVAAVAATGAEDVRVFVGTGGGVHRSEDGGATWRRANLSGTDAVVDLEAVALTSPFQTAVIVGASGRGPIWSTDRGTTWTRASGAPQDLRDALVGPDGLSLRFAGYLQAVRGRIPSLQ